MEIWPSGQLWGAVVLSAPHSPSPILEVNLRKRGFCNSFHPLRVVGLVSLLPPVVKIILIFFPTHISKLGVALHSKWCTIFREN